MQYLNKCYYTVFEKKGSQGVMTGFWIFSSRGMLFFGIIDGRMRLEEMIFDTHTFKCRRICRTRGRRTRPWLLRRVCDR